MPGELPVSPLPFSRLRSPPSLVGYFLLEKSDDAFAAVPDAGLCFQTSSACKLEPCPGLLPKLRSGIVILNVAVPNESIETEDWRGRRSYGHGGFKSAEVLTLPVPIFPSPVSASPSPIVGS